MSSLLLIDKRYLSGSYGPKLETGCTFISNYLVGSGESRVPHEDLIRSVAKGSGNAE
jgi:hypothetical protein